MTARRCRRGVDAAQQAASSSSWQLWQEQQKSAASGAAQRVVVGSTALSSCCICWHTQLIGMRCPGCCYLPTMRCHSGNALTWQCSASRRMHVSIHCVCALNRMAVNVGPSLFGVIWCPFYVILPWSCAVTGTCASGGGACAATPHHVSHDVTSIDASTYVADDLVPQSCCILTQVCCSELD
jgi:hypothetical protein